MTLRVNVSELPKEVAAAVERGDTVELQSAGRIVAVVTSTRKSLDWADYLATRRAAPPLDYEEFLADLDRIRADLNDPAEPPEWQS